jgi:hypothetical protein
MSAEASISSRSSSRASGLDRRALGGVFALICAAIMSTAAAAQNNLLAAYVVMGPDGAVARAIFPGNFECPSIELNTGLQKMYLRAGPSDQFQVTVCQKLIPPKTTSASILGQKLPVPKDSLSSIVVLGDTGCRQKKQNCYSIQWPFLKVSQLAALSHPDLVIHVGDYRYRTPDCERCDDNWQAWKDDFFDPAKDLLDAAPWIIARGNHEICGGGHEVHGNGYFLLLDPVHGPQCGGDKDEVPPYVVTLADRHFVVLDSSGAPNDVDDVSRYAGMFKELGQPTPGTWLVTHVPIWGVRSMGNIDTTLERALLQGNPSLQSNIQLFLSGHIHLWEAIGFDKGPPQFILGNGGANFPDPIEVNMDGQKIGERTVASWSYERRWGFTRFEPTPEGDWTATAVFLDARVCTITPPGGIMPPGGPGGIMPPCRLQHE